MKTIIYFTRFFFVNLFTLPSLFKYDSLKKSSSKEISDQYLLGVIGKWATKMVTNSGATVNIQGLDKLPQGNFLLVSNHQGNFDIPIIISCIPRKMGFVAKKELNKVPIISHWMRRLNCVFLDRKNLRQSMKALKDVSTYLKEGENFVLFPEGTRSQGSKMNEFKKGSLRIAVKGNVPIVPLTINGSYKLLEEKGKIVSETVNLTIHDPIDTSQLSKEEEKELSERIYTIIASKL